MRPSKFVESYFDAWNHSDPEGVADHLAKDGVYVDVPENARRDHDELVANLNQFFSSNRHRYELIGDVLTSNNSIAFQYYAHPVEDEDTGHSAPAYSGAEFMTIDGEAAVKIADYYDIPAMSNASKYAKSGLRNEQMSEYKKKLDEIMVSERAYLQPDITLPSLAESVGCSVNHLSQVINAGFEMSFFDYLNRHRVHHAKQLLRENNGQADAILNIAFTVGFNSNSAFYAAFKKHVGMTPAQFRRAKVA